MNGVTLNSSLKTNLLNLQGTQRQFEDTQYKLSTGKKVNKPSDDPSNFYAAASLTDRAKDLEGRLDGMGQAVQAISAADNGIGAMRSILDSMKAVVENALSSAGSEVTTRQALGKQFNKLLVQLKGFANDSAYGGVNLLQDDQELNVQLGAKFDESTFKVQGFHVAGASTLNENSEVGSVTESSLPVSWKVDPNAGTGYAALAPDSGIQYDPLDRSQWSSLSGVDKVVAGTAANSYTFSMKDGSIVKRSGVVQLEKLNNQYWLASEDSSGQIGYGSTVKLYAFALNKVEDPLSLVGIKSYGTDQTSIVGHEVDWGLSQSYRDDLKTVLNSIEQVDAVLETRQKLLTFDQSTINLREDYTHEFVNALETGADDLTLADLNEEATNLLALQTAQQLGVQGLSLANQQTQQVLRLLG